MSTKSKHFETNPEFQDLFEFRSLEEERSHNAQMISYRILSEVERVCEELKINKKQLAERVGSSPSYITQLFRGAKHVNMDIMARFEEALELSFAINAKMDGETQKDFVFNQVEKLNIKSCKHNQIYWTSFQAHAGTAGCPDNKLAADAVSGTADLLQRIYVSAQHENKQKAS